MHRAIAIAWITGALLAACPQQALAQRVFLEWLEKLSGPGRFKGVVVELDTFCLPLDHVDEKYDSFPRVFGIQCRVLPADVRRLTLAVDVGSLTTGRNDLPYEPDAVAGTRGDIGVLAVVGAVDFRVQRALDVGVGAGIARFSGDRFATFTRFLLQPVRVRLRPIRLVTRTGGPRLDALTISAVVANMGTITAADFGARGDFSTGGEFQVSAQVGLDVLGLLGLPKGP